MVNQPRAAKVLVLLVASMTAGAVVLLALQKGPLPSGAFSLVSYSTLNSIEQVMDEGPVGSFADRWDRVEIFYSRTAAGNISQIASLRGLSSPQDINLHFLVCNGRGAGDGRTG